LKVLEAEGEEDGQRLQKLAHRLKDEWKTEKLQLEIRHNFRQKVDELVCARRRKKVGPAVVRIQPGTTNLNLSAKDLYIDKEGKQVTRVRRGKGEGSEGYTICHASAGKRNVLRCPCCRIRVAV
jgi:hypothetical protein